MRADDGFVHAWVLPAEIADPIWSAFHDDAIAVLRDASRQLERDRPQDELAVLRGPEGFGPLRIGATEIAFNGNAFLGHAGEAFIVERRARSGVIARRTGSGGRRAVRRCDTDGHPYDLAVCALLVTLKRHLGDAMRLGTSGSLRSGWGRAAMLVRDRLSVGGQLVQQENGTLRWVDAIAFEDVRERRSSAS